MTTLSTAGAIFALIYMIIFVPIALITVILFQMRKDYQPIKARLPPLVVLTDIVLILWVTTLCIQRIVADDYPCLLNLWVSYIGTVILLNSYCIRCWILYFNYFHTQQLLADETDQLLKVDSNQDLHQTFRRRSDNFWYRHKQWTDLGRISKFMLFITLFLLIPPLILTLTEMDALTAKNGDDCDKKWGDLVLAVYVGIYVCIFMFFALTMRQVVDGFFVKEELRITGVVAIIAVIPWYLFNTIFEDVNNDTFPFSTLALLAAGTAALATSTVWPLYRSFYRPPTIQFDIPEDLSSLKALLAHSQGFRSFKEFLTREFSVENILFWDEVRQLRLQSARGANKEDLCQVAQNIYAKFIIPGAPFEVNLPGPIVNKLSKSLKEEYTSLKYESNEENNKRKSLNIIPTSSGGSQSGKHLLPMTNTKNSFSISGAKKPATPSQLGVSEANFAATIFDDAVRNIFKLMETDSYQRYVVSDLYAELIANLRQEKKTKRVLQQMDII